jgi:hypothetical protein
MLYVALITSAVGGGSRIILLFAGVFTLGQGVICLCGLLITRSNLRHMLVVPLFRIIGEPLRIYLLYKSVFAALKGRAHGWNKLARTGTVTLEPVAATQPSGGSVAWEPANGRALRVLATDGTAESGAVLEALRPADNTALATMAVSLSQNREPLPSDWNAHGAQLS